MPKSDHIVQLSGDMCRMHRRPAYQHIVVNDDYQGVKIVDPLSGLLICTRAFPEQYSSSGMIDSWFFSADGNKVLTVCEEDRSIALLDLVDETGSCIVEYPSVGTMSDLAYIWEDTFIFATGLVSKYFSLQRYEHTGKLVEQRSIDIRIKHPRWRAGLDQLPAQGSTIQRIDSGRGNLLYHDHRSNPQRLGVIYWNDNHQWSIPVYDHTSRFSCDGQYMFILQEHKLDILNDQGETVSSIPSPEGFHFWDVDVIPGDDTTSTALIILSSSLQQNSGQLLVYFVSPALMM